MPLVEVEVVIDEGPLPPEVEAYIEAAKIQIDHFHYKQKGKDIPAFVPSDFAATYRVLDAVLKAYVAPGNRFCEWGSGFGIAAGLASMLGCDACGIEIHQELVNEADRLAKHFGLVVQFVCGSLVPPGGEEIASQTFDFAWLNAASDRAYDELGLEPTDFDLIFAYPWPGEEQVIYDLFDRYAATGAVLITYHGLQGMRVQRKTNKRRKR